MIIHDTLSGRKTELPGDNIGIYLCGVTVYDDTHIGHARTIIVFDVLRRYLEETGRTVNMVQNFTDVDDKIIHRAEAEGVDPLLLSSRYVERYHEDFDALNVLRATAYPKATTHISQMISFISSLIEKGHAYVTGSGVYYLVESFPEYGRLSKKDTAQMLHGTRIELEEDKRNPADFALWKRTRTNPHWNSPWGDGRPGWHIECSAMSLCYLGRKFDIHGGGMDLVFPHHENEIAQSQGHTGIQPARVWMHTGMVTISGQKMSKSLGNIKTTRSLTSMWGPNVLRLFCLSGQYQKPIDYSDGLLAESLALWRRLEAGYCILEQNAEGVSKESNSWSCGFEQALASDLNTHGAVSSMMEMVRQAGEAAGGGSLDGHSAASMLFHLKRMLRVLGLRISTPPDVVRIQRMVRERESCRTSRDYAGADAIREEISGMNVELLDYKERTVWVYHEPIKGET